MILREIRPRRGDVIPRGWRLVEYRDFKNAAVIAPVGIHWVMKAWNWLYEAVEYRWSLALQADLLLSTRYTRSPLLPFCIDIHEDSVASRRGYGLCWEWDNLVQPSRLVSPRMYTSGDQFGRVIAPIGLNLIYAFWRWLKLQ